jgi:hypothetical protein
MAANRLLLYDLSEALGAGVEVTSCGLERGMGDQDPGLDDVGAAIRGSVAKLWRGAWIMPRQIRMPAPA